MYADGLKHALREKNVQGWGGDGDGCDWNGVEMGTDGRYG